MEPRHLLPSALTRPSSANARRLKSGHPFVPAAKQLISLSDNNNIRAALWVDHDGMRRRSGCTTLRGFVLSSPTSAPTLLEWPSQEEPGSGSTASAPVSDVSAPACTNGVLPPLRPVSVAQKNNRRPCCPPMSNPSTSPWTAWPDSSGRWDNPMDA